jgi:hypothetical protein
MSVAGFFESAKIRVIRGKKTMGRMAQKPTLNSSNETSDIKFLWKIKLGHWFTYAH